MAVVGFVISKYSMVVGATTSSLISRCVAVPAGAVPGVGVPTVHDAAFGSLVSS